MEQGFEDPVPVDRWYDALSNVVGDYQVAQQRALDLQQEFEDQNVSWETAVDAVTPAHREKLAALEQALNGVSAQDAVTREILDPDLHLLSLRERTRGVPGGTPFPFAERAQSIRRSIAKDDVAEPPAREWPADHVPVLTELQAMIVATLLQELAVRLTATGDLGGQDLATVVQGLADEVLAPTFVGAQR